MKYGYQGCDPLSPVPLLKGCNLRQLGIGQALICSAGRPLEVGQHLQGTHLRQLATAGQLPGSPLQEVGAGM